MKLFIALLILATVETVSAAETILGWTSATPTTLVERAAPTQITFIVNPTLDFVGGDTITITASSAIWGADDVDGEDLITTCSIRGGDYVKNANYAVSGAQTILTVTFISTCPAGVVTITCTDNIVANAAAGTAVTFKAVSSEDTISASETNLGYTTTHPGCDNIIGTVKSSTACSCPGGRAFTISEGYGPQTACTAGQVCKIGAHGASAGEMGKAGKCTDDVVSGSAALTAAAGATTAALLLVLSANI